MTASVLISVYARESPGNLAACLESVVNQTRPADRIVVVKDGPLNEELDATIADFEQRRPDLFHIVALPENRGLITALNRGLEICPTDYVLRMDADDIAAPGRFEKQLSYMDAHPEVAVLGTAMQEFSDDDTVVRFKPVKEDHADIVRHLPWRNPINHATVCYRTNIVKEAGGYPELRWLEDYYLWARLIVAGHRFHNLSEVLYLCRFDDDTLKRRSGWENFKNECALRLWMYRKGLMGPGTLGAVIATQLILRFSPTGLQRLMWRASRSNQP